MTTRLITDHRLAQRTPGQACASTANHFIFPALRLHSVGQPLLPVPLYYALETNYQHQKQYRMLRRITRNAIQYP